MQQESLAFSQAGEAARLEQADTTIDKLREDKRPLEIELAPVESENESSTSPMAATSSTATPARLGCEGIVSRAPGLAAYVSGRS